MARASRTTDTDEPQPSAEAPSEGAADSSPEPQDLPVHEGDTPPEDQVSGMAAPDDLAETAEQREEEAS
ncbi:hypothetical protein [Streptomyces sp. NPDC046862]|uniref:hypothetical protein n=1 Tax=Streptomyces sp. NPDC046862 TaxID=3154603 RepID=UPI003456AAFF